MKNRKSLLVAALVVMLLVLGVGYAVVSSVTLTINGTAATKNTNLKVVISDVDKKEATSPSTYGTVTDPAGLTATLTVKDMELNDTRTLVYTISNQEADIDARISKKAIAVPKSEFFEVTTSVDNSTITVPANGTNTVTVTVELIKKPVVQEDSTTDITIELNAEPIQA